MVRLILVISLLATSSIQMQASPRNFEACVASLKVLHPSVQTNLDEPTLDSTARTIELLRILIENFNAFTDEALIEVLKSHKPFSPFSKLTHIPAIYVELKETLEELLTSEDLRWSEVQEFIKNLLIKRGKIRQEKQNFAIETQPQWKPILVYESPSNMRLDMPAFFTLSSREILAITQQEVGLGGVPLFKKFRISSSQFYVQDLEIDWRESHPLSLSESNLEPGDQATLFWNSDDLILKSFDLHYGVHAIQILKRESLAKLTDEARYSPKNFYYMTREKFIFEMDGEIYAGIFHNGMQKILHLIQDTDQAHRVKFVGEFIHDTQRFETTSLREFEGEIFGASSKLSEDLHLFRIQGEEKRSLFHWPS